MFILLSLHIFRERLPICACALLSFGFEGGIWNLIVLVPNRCLSFTLHYRFRNSKNTCNILTGIKIYCILYFALQL